MGYLYGLAWYIPAMCPRSSTRSNRVFSKLIGHALGLPLVLASCNTPQPTTPPPSSESTEFQALAPSIPSDTGLTGVLSEDAFKELHELKGDAAPAPRGQMIALAGSQAYLSLPAQKDAHGTIPGIVVIHEWWGLNDHIKHWADRLADDGYATLAVDLYGGQVATDPEGAMDLMKAVDEPRAAELLGAAHEFLASDPRVNATKRGVIGWCFGGGWSLQHAIATADLDAAVIYYGRLVNDSSVLKDINAALLGVFANQDQGIPPEAVDNFVNALKQAGKSIELHRYDANHAFANPSSERYDQASASAAWDHVRTFLKRTLKDAPGNI